MSRGLGRIERVIADAIEYAHTPNSRGETGHVAITTWHLLCACWSPYKPGCAPTAEDYEFSHAQRAAVVRAMRSFVRKNPAYAVAGGAGRKSLRIYEIGDPISAAWARVSVARPGFFPLHGAEVAAEVAAEVRAEKARKTHG